MNVRCVKMCTWGSILFVHLLFSFTEQNRACTFLAVNSCPTSIHRTKVCGQTEETHEPTQGIWHNGWHSKHLRSRYSDKLWAGWPRGRSSNPGRINNIFFTSSRVALESTQPHIQWVPWTLSTGVKRPGCESDHSPPASAEIKKMGIYTFTPLYAFMA
jgi:hypothetical protein